MSIARPVKSVKSQLRAVRHTGIALICGLLTACASASAPLPPPDFEQLRTGSLGREYRLGSGDKLKVTVYEEPDLSGDFEVDAGGRIAFPLIGFVAAKGLTIDEFSSALRTRLSGGYLRNPRLSIEVMNYRPIFVHGEVKNGGQFAYKSGLRIRDAIAIAGGYTYRADHAYVLLAREANPTVKLPLSGNEVVLPGDNIRVPERFF